MKFYYVLDGKKPVEQPDFLKWGEWFEKADRTVAKTMVGNMEISTVFLSLNHNHTREGPPILFETLVFGGESSLLTALGFNEIQAPVQPIFSLTVIDIGEGKIATKQSRVFGNRAGNLIQGVDISFRTTLDISISAVEVDSVGAYRIAKLVQNALAGPDGFVIQVSPRPLSFQIGPNHGNFINTQIGDMTAASLGIQGLNISGQLLAQESIKPIDTAIDIVSAQRSTLGAVQNRLESTIANLNVPNLDSLVLTAGSELFPVRTKS